MCPGDKDGQRQKEILKMNTVDGNCGWKLCLEQKHYGWRRARKDTSTPYMFKNIFIMVGYM